MSDEELRRWAMEQVVKLHGGTGLNAETMISEAMKLIAMVKPQPAKDA